MSDEAYNPFMDATYGDTFNIKTFVEYDEPFQDASFYSPGAIANVSSGDRIVEIDVVGDLYLCKDELHIMSSCDLRLAFPDGNIDLDDWRMEKNRWFEMTLVINGQPYPVESEVAFEYDEAISFAKGLIEDDENWTT